MKLGQTYQKAEIEKFQKEHYPNTEYRYGVTLDKRFFIRFGQFEFWETEEDHVFKCFRNEEEGYLEAQNESKFGTAIKLKDNVTSKRYYQRMDSKSREARKYGYKPNG